MGFVLKEVFYLTFLGLSGICSLLYTARRSLFDNCYIGLFCDQKSKSITKYVGPTIALEKQNYIYLYDIIDIPHQLEKLNNLNMRRQPFKKGGCYDYFNPVTFICAFPMQRAFVKVIIFHHGFCLERGLLPHISRSVGHMFVVVHC
jgi:hypothetical protein